MVSASMRGGGGCDQIEGEWEIGWMKQKTCLLCLDSRLLVEICLSGLVAKKSEVIKFITTKIPV